MGRLKAGRRRVSVVALGDLGRSPRMQYQTLSLAAELADVDFIGYGGSALPRTLVENARVHIHRLPTPRSLDPRRGARMWLDAVVRFVRQTLQLLRLLLFGVPRPAVILVQNPPAIPTLGVAWLAARLRSARLVVDWHNLGYTLLGMKLGPRHPLVSIMAWAERLLGRRADAHLCVSQAMRQELEERWRLRDVRVLYDRLPTAFVSAPPALRHDLLRRLATTLGVPSLARRGDRPAVLVSSTSWTLDEDFSLLADAAVRVDAVLAGRESFPRLLILVTGRGPLRAHYEERFEALRLHHVQLRTLWLAPEDYPVLLAAADLGLCFHRSSSALDLPMKVADMLGAGLPVCAVDYGAVLAERLRPGENGLLFSSAEELAEHIVELFTGFPGADTPLEDLRQALRGRPPRSWDEGWRQEAQPTFEEALR